MIFRGKNRVGGIRARWHITHMSDYERIAKVIRFIDERGVEQLDLEELAKVVGLSPSRFHRLFSEWAGITPTGFIQCLTMKRAAIALREGAGVLDAAVLAGLSGPGRLHNPSVSLEAASPGEIKSGGAGWIITAGTASSPFGECLIAESPRGICHLSFGRDWGRLERDWPSAELVRDDEAAGRWAESIFQSGDGAGPLKLFVRGTQFQRKVWRALLRIPGGSLTSYGKLAAFIGSPKAARAVGTAVGKNPIGYLIPCHRVICETGLFGGYRWGVERKRAIQVWESAAPSGR